MCVRTLESVLKSVVEAKKNRKEKEKTAKEREKLEKARIKSMEDFSALLTRWKFLEELTEKFDDHRILEPHNCMLAGNYCKDEVVKAITP